MSDKARKIKVEQVVRASPERVFDALTQALRLQEWFCNQASVEPVVGGQYTFRWHSGYETRGSFIEVDRPEELEMTWQGLGEPGQTLVEWELEEKDGLTEVTVEHVGFGSGPHWNQAYVEAEKGWAEALENLRSVLEEGVDLRDLRRPFLGIIFDGMNAERAEKEGIATETGIYVTDTVEGSAAREAGLQKGDVIVAIGGRDVLDIATLTAALQACRAGDAVEVEMVRKQERLTVQATLKQREAPSRPSDPHDLAAMMREHYAELNARLTEITAGLTEEEAAQAPAEDEWSVKQTLAHLSISERELQETIANLLGGVRVEGDVNVSVWPGYLAAVIAAEESLAGLLGRLARDEEQSALLIEHLAEQLLAEPYRYRTIAQLATGFGAHGNEHAEQVRRAVETVRAQS